MLALRSTAARERCTCLINLMCSLPVDADDCAAASLQVAMFCCQLELWLCLLLRFRGMSGHHTCVFLQMLQ